MLARDDVLRVLLRIAGELLIRSSQTKRYLDEIRPGEAGEYWQLAETIRAALEGIEQLLPETVRAVRSGSDKAVTPEGIEVLYRLLEKFSAWFTTIHELLVYLPQSAVTPESKATLRSSFGALYEDLSPSIILGSLFNALEFDFFQLIRTRLPGFDEIDIRETENIVLQLAICDRDAPASWAILGHELGHAIDQKFAITEKIVPKFVTDPNSAPFKILSSWCQEFCADLLAARALGPSPILALLSLEYCVFPLRPVFYASKTHPATSWRLAAVTSFLRRLYERKDYLQVEREFYALAALYSLERSEPDEARRRSLEEADRLQFRHVALPLVRELQREIVLLNIPAHNLNAVSIERCSDRLYDGLPVSAQGKSKRELREALTDYKSESYRTKDERVVAFKRLAADFKEEPLDIPAILMSGQELRLKLLTPSPATEMDLGVLEGIQKLTGGMRRLDELVSASINMSGVHKQLRTRQG